MIHGVGVSLVVQCPGSGFHLMGSGLIPYYSTKTSQVTQHRRQSPKTISENNAQHPKTLREAHTKVLQYFWKVLWACCGQCGVSSISDLALLHPVLGILGTLPKSTAVPKVYCLRLTVGVKSAASAASGANSPSLLQSHSSFGLGPASSHRPPLGFCYLPRHEGWTPRLIRAHVLTQARETEWNGIHSWGVPGCACSSTGFADVVTDWGRSCALPEEMAPGRVSLGRPSWPGFHEGMGSNLYLFTAWWQLPPLGSGPQWWHFICYLRRPPGFGTA